MTKLVHRRLALHKYDPPDLQASLASVAPPAVTESPTGAVPPTSEWSMRDHELAEAKKKGLLVDMGGGTSKTTTKTSPTSVVFMEDEAGVQDEMKELDLWETSRTNDEDFEWDNGNDSDDDLL